MLVLTCENFLTASQKIDKNPLGFVVKVKALRPWLDLDCLPPR
jgi:hypothetical protein